MFMFVFVFTFKFMFMLIFGIVILYIFFDLLLTCFYIGFMFMFITGQMATNDDHPRDDSVHDGDKAVSKTEMEYRRGMTIMKRIIRDRDQGIKYKVHWSQ